MGGLWKRGHVEAGDIVKCRDCKERKPAVARYEHWCRGWKLPPRRPTDECGRLLTIAEQLWKRE